MVTVNLTHAKAHLTELLDQVEAGEDVLITPRRGRAVAHLSPAAAPKTPLRPLAEFREKMPRWRRPSATLLQEGRDEGL